MEQHQEQQQTQWRRDKVQELCSKGYSQREITNIARNDQSIMTLMYICDLIENMILQSIVYIAAGDLEKSINTMSVRFRYG
ncbi:MAG: hypothetical protein ACJ705_03345 [Nitrososphaeraceae archaeon]